jgi:hypothetical protein
LLHALTPPYSLDNLIYYSWLFLQLKLQINPITLRFVSCFMLRLSKGKNTFQSGQKGAVIVGFPQ